ncbi:MAG: terpene cyclase/mutase family protein [Bacteroidetes bacterium]|nr:terpene cyclase/mutase family protein [Bacteroidota bacterium]
MESKLHFWLFESADPSIRYASMLNLMDADENSLIAKESRKKIMTSTLVQKILSSQNDDGYWGKKEDFYLRSKYKGTVWNMILLSELYADGNDSRIKKMCEFVLNYSQNNESGGFAYKPGPDGNGYDKYVIPCLTGNMLAALIRFGYMNDERVKKGIDWIIKYQRFDDGESEPQKDYPYCKLEKCWGSHTCFLGVVKNLNVLTEIPENQRNADIKEMISQSVEFILKHHIYKRSHNLDEISNLKWTELGFPLMWDTDILEVLTILDKLGIRDERMNSAIDLIVTKMKKDGTWIMEKSFNGKMLVRIEQVGKPSQWITLKALALLKNLNIFYPNYH